MATYDKPKRGPVACRDCGSDRGDIRRCQATSRQLCQGCWPKVDPRKVRVADPEELKGETEGLAFWARRAG